ncbi:hypothetical protein V8F33_014215 [Rhypophila sp. PSN 637]
MTAAPTIDWFSPRGAGDDFRSIPRIEWTKIEDDYSEDGIGYSAGNGWVEWVSDHHEAVPYRITAVRQYGKAVETFREGMLTIMHMLGGMPARSNTAYGGVRNIIIDRGMVCFVKIIHRYLPRDAGELLQQVQGIADEILQKVGEAGQEGEGSVRRGGGGGKGRELDWIRERKWTADRIRRIIQGHTGRFLSVRIGISAWRHIAIGISNRYLNQAFQPDKKGGGDFDEDDEDTVDSVWDLQAGHSTHVAGMIYARELQQGALGTAVRRDGFRRVSRQWYRFLGFGVEEGGVVGGKRKAELFRRLERLRRVDIEGQLRGSQKKVIQAIVRGESRIVQVAGTGEGKSLSFMLPAFCSPDGVTVVVVPLERGIDSHIWAGRGMNRAASVIFITPESAVTKGFETFVNRLHGRGQLDRVVIDECHTVLDSERGFRP